MKLDLTGLQNSSRVVDQTIHVWQAKNCFDEWAYVNLVRIDKTWLWAFKDSERSRNWIGFPDWQGVKSRLEEFYGGRRKARHK